MALQNSQQDCEEEEGVWESHVELLDVWGSCKNDEES